MTCGPPSAAEEESTEISVLVKTLRAADQRLEELTAGEVDTVVDRDGRSYVLGRAQNQLRYHEAAKQAAVLNALPAQIALLDPHGIIVSVNDTWRRRGDLNLLRHADYGIGVNYLAVCDGAWGPDALGAHEVAAGIRAVLSGRSERFSLEYPCHSPTQEAWFLLTVTPLNQGSPDGAVVMHVDITAEKRSAEALRHFVAAMDATADAIYLVDRDAMRFVHFNDAACRMQSKTREQVFAAGPEGVLGVSRAELESTYDELIASGTPAKPVEVLRRRADGSCSWLELRRQAHRLGERWAIVTLVRDVTERKAAEARIGQLNRVHAMLSGINSLIVRARDRTELFQEACRIAADAGGFPIAWIGMLRDAAHLVPLAAVSADDALLSFIDGPLLLTDAAAAESGIKNSLIVQSIKEKRLVVVDPHVDAHAVFSPKFAAAGMRSGVIFPLLNADEAVGVLVLYARESDFFHSDELKLLTELAGDVAFAIDHIDKQERLEYLAYYDMLTGLANRTLFLDRVTQYIRSAVNGGHKVALLLLDLERFKNLNDSLGRPAGDELLKQVALWLTGNVGDVSLLARLGADQFAVVLPAVTQEGDLARLLEKTLAAFLSHPFQLNQVSYRVAAKAGVALFPDDGANADVLFRNAEAALKKAKAGGDRYLFYAQKMTDTVAGRLSLENRLHLALDLGQFVLYYQPKFSVLTGKLTGAEALIRWNDPHTGLVPPARFIPILEETGLIHDVGRWALHKAIEDYLCWRRAGLAAVPVAVNVSPRQLRGRGFVMEVEKAVGVDPWAAPGLELEITESLIMEDVKHSIASLREIRSMGVRVAVDDFGTGYSSLSYLAKLPINTLKVDRSFVLDMATGPEGRALVSMIINLAHSMNLSVVAEGVENDEQLRILRMLACDEMQGYLFSEPIPGDSFASRYLT